MSKVLFVLVIPGDSKLNPEVKDNNNDPNDDDLKNPGTDVDVKDVAKTVTPRSGTPAKSLDRDKSETGDKHSVGAMDQAPGRVAESSTDHPALQKNSQSDKDSLKQKSSSALGNFFKRRKSLPVNNLQAKSAEKGITSSKSSNTLSQYGVEEKNVSKQKSKKNIDIGEDPVDMQEYISLISDRLTLIERVKLTLARLEISSINWSYTPDDMHIAMFIAGGGERCEEILDKLTVLDIGVIPGSSVSVFPASISLANADEQIENLEEELEKESKLAEKVSEFKKSIKSRLVVAQVVDSVKSDAIFSFDFLMLVLLASLVAMMGLLEASSVTLVASMLISPLMGPILAIVFGSVIKNKELMRVGFSSELKGLALCITVGFLSGCIPAFLESGGMEWRSTDSWPTIEMSSRGAARSLLVGVLIALPSGAGVALSILGGKVGSLVGVAISASLLPPAVNAGLLWANALIVSIIPPKTIQISQYSLAQNMSEQAVGLVCPMLLNNDYVHIYSCSFALESVVLGVVSLLLTIVNIFCIILMGIAVLKIKEVAPIRSAPNAEQDFFARDLKVARASYETAKGPNSTILGKKFLQEYRKMKGEIGEDEDSSEIQEELNELLEDVEEAQEVQEILDKLPHGPKRWSSFVDNEDIRRNPYHTFHGGLRSHNHDTYHGVRNRMSAMVDAPLAVEEDDKMHRSYLTVHHSQRASHFSPIKWSSKKLKGRFHVARVEEDRQNNAVSETKTGCTAKFEILPVIKEQENTPLLTLLPAKESGGTAHQ